MASKQTWSTEWPQLCTSAKFWFGSDVGFRNPTWTAFEFKAQRRGGRPTATCVWCDSRVIIKNTWQKKRAGLCSPTLADWLAAFTSSGRGGCTSNHLFLLWKKIYGFILFFFGKIIREKYSWKKKKVISIILSNKKYSWKRYMDLYQIKSF